MKLIAGMLVGVLLTVVVGSVCLRMRDMIPHSPCPPSPNCQCGCTRTGNCLCKDCDHPKLEVE